jgi:hypothetical protein
MYIAIIKIFLVQTRNLISKLYLQLSIGLYQLCYNETRKSMAFNVLYYKRLM